MVGNKDGFIFCIRVIVTDVGVCAVLLTPIRGFLFFQGLSSREGH